MDDDDFTIFGSDQDGRPGDIEEVMQLIQHYVSEHELTVEEALNILFDLVRPGSGPNSHDVRPIFVGAMYAYEYGYLSKKFESLYITTMPWGIGFSIAVEQGFKFRHLVRPEQQAIIRSLCVVLQSGGLDASLDGDGHIILTDPNGETTKMDVDEIVAQFRTQLDTALGPDGPDDDDPMRRWMP
jgi:hypothetical protein